MSFAVRAALPRVAAAARLAPQTAAARRAFTVSAPRRDFGWNKLVTPLTNPAFISRMKEMDQKFSAMKTEMAGVAPTVEPIDWASFEASIENKEFVRAVRKEYESLKFEDIKGEDLSKINADLDFAITKASGAAEISKAEIPAVRAQLAAAVEEKRTVLQWTLDDYCARYPGLAEQLRADYMNGEYLPTDAEERLEAQDVAEARKQFKAGVVVSMPDEIYAERVGDFNLKDELARTDAMLDRMFGGSKAYEQIKAANKEADAKRMAAAKAHTEEEH